MKWKTRFFLQDTHFPPKSFNSNFCLWVNVWHVYYSNPNLVLYLSMSLPSNDDAIVTYTEQGWYVLYNCLVWISDLLIKNLTLCLSCTSVRSFLDGWIGGVSSCASKKGCWFCVCSSACLHRCPCGSCEPLHKKYIQYYQHLCMCNAAIILAFKHHKSCEWMLHLISCLQNISKCSL